MSTQKRIFIIHGWEGTPQSNWFPWLKKKLEMKGFSVEVPAMPDTMHPILNKWLTIMRELVGNVDENTYFVGHNLGVITILRYLESLPENKKIGGAVLVAGFSEPIGYDELNSFLLLPLDYEKIKKATKNIIAIHSDNDPYVSLKNGETLKKKLDAKLVIVPKAGHFNAGDGFTELPIVLDSLLEIIK